MMQEMLTLTQELIAENGREVLLQTLDRTPSDASRPWMGPDTPQVVTSLSASAVFVPASGTELGIGFVSDDFLARVEQVCLVAATSDQLDFAKVRRLKDGDVTWGVEWVHVLNPGNLTLLYAFGVKR